MIFGISPTSGIWGIGLLGTCQLGSAGPSDRRLRPWSCATPRPTKPSAPTSRAWLDATLPQPAPQPARDAWTERRKWDTDWQRRLFDAGYAGLHWPAEYGGRGASPTEQLIFYEETAQRAGALRRRELRRHACTRARR